MYRKITAGGLTAPQLEALAALVEQLAVLEDVNGFEVPGPLNWAATLGRLDAVRDAMGGER